MFNVLSSPSISGIIGGSNGEILLVDLSSGQCIGITKVKGEIMSLEIFKDGSSGDCVFLLVSCLNNTYLFYTGCLIIKLPPPENLRTV